MIIKNLSLAFIASSVILTSCGNHEDAKSEMDEAKIDSTLSVVDTASVEEADQEVSYNLPSALQIAYVFKKSGAPFMPNLLNNIANVNKYNTGNYKRATNFGVYSSDLAYCLFSKKYQESKNYLKACKEVGGFLGLNQAFDGDNMAQRFDKNISVEDSVVKIVSNIQLKTDVMFEQNKQKYVTVIAFAGAWTESVYIASEVYAKEKNKKVLTNLLEQLQLSGTIIKALKNCEKNESEIPTLISSIEKINTAFNAIEALKKASESEEDVDYSTVPVADGELKAITTAIAELRKQIIE